jgi:hypothetical protein
LHSSSAVRTALWGETTDITKDVPIGKVKGWRCNHCDAESWNRNAARLQFHLSGNAELRDAENGFCGIDVCKKVPDAVSQLAQAEMVEKASEKDSSTKRSASAAEMSEAESLERASNIIQIRFKH